MKKFFIVITIFSFILISYKIFAAEADKVVLKFKVNEKWITEETSIIKGMLPPVSHSTNENTVIKIFPDGAALLITKAVKVETGDTVEKLKVLSTSPLLNKEIYKLITSDGRIYLPQAKPVFDSPEEQMASEEFDFIDEIELLKKSKTTTEYFRKTPNNIDSYFLPEKAINIGESVIIEGWVVTRLEDDSGSMIFESRKNPVIKKVYIDNFNGKIMLMKIKQGNEIEMTYKRIK